MDQESHTDSLWAKSAVVWLHFAGHFTMAGTVCIDNLFSCLSLSYWSTPHTHVVMVFHSYRVELSQRSVNLLVKWEEEEH